MISDGTKMHVGFWGTRGSISTPGRVTEKYGGNTPCVAVRCHDVQIIFDAGTGIRNLGIDLLEENKRDKSNPSLHLFLSHTHWDHIQGLPFFQPSYLKDTKLNIYGSPNKEKFLASILQDQMNYDYFPVSMSAFAADINIQEIMEDVVHLDPLAIEWQEQIYHPGGSVRYKVSLDGKKVVYATDVELNRILDANGDKEKKAMDDYTDFIQGVDLLIADAQYTDAEYADKIGWGHSSISVLLDIASKAKVKRLAIFHHDPQHSDKFLDELWVSNRARFNTNGMELFWAREGMTLAI
ncbi:MAG: MBL fold metallo-hydrolase [Deltaproteobacteria bacterium]|nr:MBL fold metallo-hydrolase [Deltaproteobacteria bacterium]